MILSPHLPSRWRSGEHMRSPRRPRCGGNVFRGWALVLSLPPLYRRCAAGLVLRSPFSPCPTRRGIPRMAWSDPCRGLPVGSSGDDAGDSCRSGSNSSTARSPSLLNYSGLPAHPCQCLGRPRPGRRKCSSYTRPRGGILVRVGGSGVRVLWGMQVSREGASLQRTGVRLL